MKNITAYFHLPGLFEFLEFYKVFLPIFHEHREYFYEWCDIGSIYGAPADCLWGGGRVGFGTDDAEEVLELVRKYGISARLTFSNSLIREEHLTDRKCNRLCEMFVVEEKLGKHEDFECARTIDNVVMNNDVMQQNEKRYGMNNNVINNDVIKQNKAEINNNTVINNGVIIQNSMATKDNSVIDNSVMNGVIIYSDLLMNYIRSNYPGYYFVSSTTKVITDWDLFVKELNRPEFKYVVADFRLNKQLDRLNELSAEQKDKVEFLCNECCSFGCTDRKACYENVSRKALLEVHPDHECKSVDLSGGYRFSQAMKNPGFISVSDIVNTYLPAGFSNFKIEGRSLGSAVVLEFILYYMTKPEYQLNVREMIYLDAMLDLF